MPGKKGEKEEKKKKRKRTPDYNIEPAEKPVEGPTGHKVFKV